MPDQKTSFSTNKSNFIIIIGIIVSCLLVYAQTIYFDFINIDDRAYVYENLAVLSGLNWRSAYWAFTAFHSANWHPLTWLSHMADVSLFGTNAGMHHATNVLLHTIDSILAFIVFKRLTGDIWQSAAVALLFALHPAHVESVAWIAERRDVLSTLFWLLTMLAYIKYVETAKKSSNKVGVEIEPAGMFGNPRFWLLATFMLFACGLMSKAMLVTLPFVLLLCDYWSLERLNKVRDLPRLIVEKLPLFALTIASSIVTFVAQASFGATVSLKMLPLNERLMNVALSYAKYIVMMFYPVNLGLWYPFEEKVEPLRIIGSIILLTAVTAFCWRQRKKRRYFIMGWLWFLGTLVPVIGLVQVGLQSLADRYTYVPYFGLFIMLVWGAADLVKHFRINVKVVAFVCAVTLLVLGVLTYSQVSKWKNSGTLYTHTLSFTKNNYFLMSNLCLYYLKNASVEIAERRCTELLEATPPSPEAYSILGQLRTEIGKYDDAARYFENALKMNPTWGILYAHYAITLAKQGKTEGAEKALRRAKAATDGSISKPTLARVFNEVALAVEKKGQTEIARQYFAQAVELNPSFAEAAANLKRLSSDN